MYAQMMTTLTEEMLDTWTDGEPRAIHDEMMELTLRIVSQALFGVDIDRYVDDIEAAVNDFLPATTSLPNLMIERFSAVPAANEPRP